MSNSRRLAALALCAAVTSGGCLTRYVASERWENKNLAYLAGELAVGAALGGMLAYDHNRNAADDDHFEVGGGMVIGAASAVFGDIILAGVVAIFTGDWNLDDD